MSYYQKKTATSINDMIWIWAEKRALRGPRAPGFDANKFQPTNERLIYKIPSWALYGSKDLRIFWGSYGYTSWFNLVFSGFPTHQFGILSNSLLNTRFSLLAVSWFWKPSTPGQSQSAYFLQKSWTTGWCPPVISWFINPLTILLFTTNRSWATYISI